jgi:TonB family protein
MEAEPSSPATKVELAQPITLAPEDVVKSVTVTKHSPPNYSTKLKRECGEGRADVRVLIDRNSTCTKVELVSATCEGLGKETMRTVKKWSFKPATVNGRPVAAYYPIHINYRMQP